MPEITQHFQNFYVTKLREACSDTATTIYVDTPPTITSGILVLEYANQTKVEIIGFTGVSGYALTGCVRGMENTTAQTHNIGADVRQNVTAGMLDQSLNMQCLQSVNGTDQNNPVSQKALRDYLTPATGLDASKINTNGLRSDKVKQSTSSGNNIEFSTSTTQPAAKTGTDIIWFEPQE